MWESLSEAASEFGADTVAQLHRRNRSKIKNRHWSTYKKRLGDLLRPPQRVIYGASWRRPIKRDKSGSSAGWRPGWVSILATAAPPSLAPPPSHHPSLFLPASFTSKASVAPYNESHNHYCPKVSSCNPLLYQMTSRRRHFPPLITRCLFAPPGCRVEASLR